MSNKANTTTPKPDGKPALTPKLRFPEFRGAAGWEQLPLSELVGSLDAGVSVNSGDRPAAGNEIGVLKTSAVTNGIFEPQENKVVFDEAERGRVKEPVQGGTIIISRMNTPALVGANAYVETSLENIFLPDRLWAAKSKPGTSMRFVASILGSDKGRAALSKLAKGSSGSMKNITKPDVFAFLIMAPSPAEQQKIAECLSSVDELMAAQARKLDALKTHKKGLMQRLFPREGETQPRLRFPEFQNAGEWDKAKLGNHVAIGSGNSPSSFTLSSKGKYALVKVEDLNNCTKYQITGREFCDESGGAVPMNSIVFPKRGAAIDLNKIRITATEILIDTNLMALTPKNGLTTEFLYYYIADVGLSHIADTSTIPQINNKHIIPFDFLLPSLPEQQRIADCLTSLDELIAAQTQKFEALKTHKKGLMQQLFPSPEAVEA